MPRSTESLKITKEDLYGQLKAMGMKPSGIDSNGKATIASEAEIFKFNYIHDGEDYGTGRMSLTTTRGKPTVLMDYSRDLTKAPGWSKFISRMSRWVTDRGLSWEPSDEDNSDLDYDLAKRKHMERMNESYHAMGRMKSYNDAIPETKIIIQHNKVMEDGEQRFRYVEKIFIENALGERILAPTTKPGIAKVYARHIAEGGLPHDERWKHISGLCEEYTKMAGFVRATRSNQFNESAQQLVNEGINHYFNLRETLNKMIGKKGYNSYFESWTPTLTEDEEATDLSEMFMTSSLDPRIESVMPILGKLSKNISETKMKEVDELAEWADSVIESELNEVDMGQYDAVKSTTKGKDDTVFAKHRERMKKEREEHEKNKKQQGVAEADKHYSNTKNPVDFPKTWHDVDKKLGKAVDKMSQAEKVKKGLAHPDTLKKKGVAEGSDELYQQAIRKYTQRVANDYLGGGNAHLYGAGNFDSEMFGVDPKQAEQDFDALFPQCVKKLQGGGQGVAEGSMKRIIGYRVVGTDIFIPIKDFEQDGRYYELRGYEFEPVWDDEQGVAEGIGEEYNDMSDRELMRHARMLGLEKEIVPDEEGGLANRNRIIYLLQQQLDDEDLEEGEITPVPSGHKGLNKQQKAAGQLDADDKVQPTGPILGAEPKSQKGLRGKLVGASESVDPLERIKKLTK